MKNKGGRPRVSKLGIDTSNRKEYDKRYRQACRYIFTVNLSQETDADIIDALETLCAGNRQKALKRLVRDGVKYNRLCDKQLLESGLVKQVNTGV